MKARGDGYIILAASYWGDDVIAMNEGREEKRVGMGGW